MIYKDMGSRVITRRKMSITLNGFQHIKKQPQHIARNIYQKTEFFLLTCCNRLCISVTILFT